MNSTILFFSRKIFSLIPETRGFGFKRWLLRLAGAEVGNNVRLSSTVRIIGTSKLKIGDNTWIGHETMIICSDSVIIGANVNIAPRCYIGTGTHIIDTTGYSIAGKGVTAPIVIEDGAWLCVGAIIIPGSVIGKQSIVAAGSVVKGGVKPRELVGGGLAKHIKDY